MEAVLVVPAFMMAVLLAIQVALWAHAEHVVHAAAVSGQEAAQELGSSPDAGRSAAKAFLDEGAGNLLGSTVISETVSGDQAVVRVKGDVQSILPWLKLPVSAVSIAPVQEFRSSG